MKTPDQIRTCGLLLAEIVRLGARVEPVQGVLEKAYFDLLTGPADSGRWEELPVFGPNGDVDHSALAAVARDLAGEEFENIWESFSDLCFWASASRREGGESARVAARNMSAARLFRCASFIALARMAGVPAAAASDLNSIVIDSAK